MYILKRGIYYLKLVTLRKKGNEFDENSILAPLFSEKEMDAMSSGDEYDDELTMLKDIRDGSQ